MHYNCTFDTYRRETSAGKRQYASSKTITSGDGFIEPASPDLQSTLGLDSAVRIYMLRTEESNFQKTDKVVISTESYYIDGLEIQDLNGVSYSRLILRKDA